MHQRSVCFLLAPTADASSSVAFASSASFAASASLPQWESLIRQALRAERDGQPAAANAGYEHALSVARRLVDKPPAGRAGDCIAALVVSHLNLADLHAAQGDVDAAASLRSRAHEALIALFVDTERDASLRQAALRHSRETHLALIAHVGQHGPDPHVTHALRAGCLALAFDGRVHDDATAASRH